MLRQIRSNSGENIQLYVESVMWLADVDLECHENNRFIESQLVDMFANGLSNGTVKTIF